MSYAELIEKLQTLPEAKQAEAFDFVDFLANRNQAVSRNDKTLAESALAELIRNPLQVDDFTPLRRDQYE
ncbi:MAG: DUF2281 domain-containing protein [Methylobacter sp.]